ncbi:MAG: GCN5-related N-acetyltransferase [Haloplasmataceae bacterium]|jgi:RimJ/RimL family protein N-acetyltransferase|nr:GCN5-related N-acetyltransferase [Haloplasmataceae bacterium]
MKFVVREIIPEDLNILFKFVSDPEIAYYTDFNRDITLDVFKERYEFYFSEHDDLKIFSIVLDNIVVGKMEIGYDLENKTGLFEIIIGNKQLWGSGISKKALTVLFNYAFNNLGLNRLSCEVYLFNERSINLMKKMNMQIDGILREAQMIENQFVDICIFSILRKEFEGGIMND